MNVKQLLEQMEMLTTDPDERRRRVEHCLDALAKGAEIIGIFDKKVTKVALNSAGTYTVQQEWTVQP